MPDTQIPPPGTECAEHRGRPATVCCGVCYRPVCEECRDSSAPEPRCRRCSVSEILTEVKAQWEAKAKRRASLVKENEDTQQQKSLWRRLMLGAVAVVVCALMVTSLSDTYLRGHPVYAVNLPAEGGPGLNGCLREMWEARGALEQYVVQHGACPHTLEEAMDGKAPDCPACGRPYRYERIDALRYLLFCPEPARHRVGGIRVNSGSAPTILDRDAR